MEEQVFMEWHKLRIDEIIDGKKSGFKARRKAKKYKNKNVDSLKEDKAIYDYIEHKYEDFSIDDMILEHKRFCRKIETLKAPFGSNALSISIPIVIGAISILVSLLISCATDLCNAIGLAYIFMLLVFMFRISYFNHRSANNFYYYIMINNCLDIVIHIKKVMKKIKSIN